MYIQPDLQLSLYLFIPTCLYTDEHIYISKESKMVDVTNIYIKFMNVLFL